MLARAADADRSERGSAPGRMLQGLRVLASDPRALRFGAAYMRSLLTEASPLESQTPWLTYRATDWLSEHVGSDANVFEFGSGGSTLFLTARAGKVVSIEHDPTWFDATRTALERAGRDNCEYVLVEPESSVAGGPLYESSDARYAGLSFRRYASAIDAYPDDSFDLVLVDGRARPACVIHSRSKVRRGGHLLLDDAQRPVYSAGVEALAEWPRLDFPGPAPGKTERSVTSVWRRP